MSNVFIALIVNRMKEKAQLLLSLPQVKREMLFNFIFIEFILFQQRHCVNLPSSLIFSFSTQRKFTLSRSYSCGTDHSVCSLWLHYLGVLECHGLLTVSFSPSGLCVTHSSTSCLPWSSRLMYYLPGKCKMSSRVSQVATISESKGTGEEICDLFLLSFVNREI